MQVNTATGAITLTETEKRQARATLLLLRALEKHAPEASGKAARDAADRLADVVGVFAGGAGGEK